MQNKQLLREWYSVDASPEIIKESREKNGGKLVLNGIIQRANTKNQNKRVYPRNILRREVDRYQKAVQESRALGEADHPESSTVSLKNVSHVIREIRWDGDDVYGRVEILPTPCGKIVEALVDSGIRIGISSRGVGSTEKTNEGYDEVQDDYQLIAFDLVTEPSTPGAYLSEGISLESRVDSRAARIDEAIASVLSVWSRR